MDEISYFKRGQSVFKEEANDVRGIYLVLQGEFEISKNISKFQYDAETRVSQESVKVSDEDFNKNYAF